MPSIRRLISSRANAAHSTGPKTAEGKRRSSQNALRHGLRSGQPIVLLPNESPEKFHQHLQNFVSRYKPRTPAEKDCVDRMASAQWALWRICALEKQMVADARAAQPHLDEMEALLTLFTAPAHVLLMRYEATQTHNLVRAANDLKKLRDSPLAPQLPPALVCHK